MNRCQNYSPDRRIVGEGRAGSGWSGIESKSSRVARLFRHHRKFRSDKLIGVKRVARAPGLGLVIGKVGSLLSSCMGVRGQAGAGWGRGRVGVHPRTKRWRARRLPAYSRVPAVQGAVIYGSGKPSRVQVSSGVGLPSMRLDDAPSSLVPRKAYATISPSFPRLTRQPNLTLPW